MNLHDNITIPQIYWCINFRINRSFFKPLLWNLVVGSVFGFMSINLGGIFASVKMYRSLSNGILHAPISYFDQTPIGRILARFSKDIYVVDVDLPNLLDALIYQAAEVI